MKTPVLLPVMAGLIAMTGTGLAQAQEEQGRVVSSTPIIQQVAVPREVCTDEQVTYQGRKSGAGALIGAIAGGAAGNAIGKGSGRAAATAIGLIGGAIVGNRIEGEPAPHTEVVRSCGTQTYYEPRTVAFDVVYEYAGRQYRTQMAQDPGRYVRLNVTPVDGLPPPPAYNPSRPQVRYETPAPQVIYSGYEAPTYPAISTELVIIGGQRYHRAPGWVPPGHRGHDRFEHRQ
ncbi:MAG: glycine zipper 2TM domain-containing protein [Hydrogenophaga sp.]|uniref:glycine zipper 2TM domain-containing protein n=1 Tax=Hydrogenophaga sp. TaxID=1904254 RepID=UPI001D795671|nr:glycine zipper 2TM domain-containing protein [Hydrogenophaga sp.]MBX3611916.1 glycine zipper 2TM domain-containing protein [Hydrogenophaga sp.]